MRYLLALLLGLTLAAPATAQTPHVASLIRNADDVAQMQWTYVYEHAPDTSVAVMREIRRHANLAEAQGQVLMQDSLVQYLAEIEAQAQALAAQRDSAFALADTRAETIAEQARTISAQADTIAAQEQVLDAGRAAALATLEYLRALVEDSP